MWRNHRICFDMKRLSYDVEHFCRHLFLFHISIKTMCEITKIANMSEIPSKKLRNYRRRCFHFSKSYDVHEHRTRQAKHDFLPPKPKTNYLKKAFSYRGAVAWNNLPSEIKNSETVNIFKAKLKIIN